METVVCYSSRGLYVTLCRVLCLGTILWRAKLESVFMIKVLKKAVFPKESLALGIEGITGIWHEAKMVMVTWGEAE